MEEIQLGIAVFYGTCIVLLFYLLCSLIEKVGPQDGP